MQGIYQQCFYNGQFHHEFKQTTINDGSGPAIREICTRCGMIRPIEVKHAEDKSESPKSSSPTKVKMGKLKKNDMLSNLR